MLPLAVILHFIQRLFYWEKTFMKVSAQLFSVAGVSCVSLFVGVAFSQTPNSPKPLAPPNADMIGLEAASEQEFFVGMVATKELCKERHPKQAMQIERSFNAKFVEAPTELKKFAMTREFPPRVAKRIADQREIIKQPAEAAQLDGTCKRLANAGRGAKK
jgi:hypothetical protein